MELNKIDIFILNILFNYKDRTITIRQIGKEIPIDNTNIYKSLKSLIEYQLVLVNNDRPKGYKLNIASFDKWIKN